MEANEIDGEVLGTFESLQELCENTGLECVVDLARLVVLSVANTCRPLKLKMLA